MAELRIGELVDPTVRAHREVAPDRRRRLEGDPFNFPGRGLEAFVGVLGRDARREDVLLDGPVYYECDGVLVGRRVCASVAATARRRGGRAHAIAA